MRGIEQYAKNNETEEITADFINAYHDLVKKIVWPIKRKLPSFIEVDDLMQAGFIGLIQAKKNYNPEREASFQTYAQIRIKGAVIDEIRRLSWGYRDVAKYTRLINEAICELEQRHQRAPTQLEIANELSMGVDEYDDICQYVAMNQVVSNDLSDELADAYENSPDVHYEEENLSNYIKEFLLTLPERDQQMIAMYYVEEFTFKEIADIFDLSEARVCQIHSQIIQKIKSHVLSE